MKSCNETLIVLVLLFAWVSCQTSPISQDAGGETSLFISLLRAMLYTVGRQTVHIQTTVSLAEKQGYSAESHPIVTEDGYYLTLHHIKSKLKCSNDNDECEERSPKVVFLQHGLMGSSDNWLTTRRNESLAYQLADLGYEVWMGNFRGNIYSRGHQVYSIQNSTFWKFSYDEMAKYDLPAMITYVLNQTGVDTIDYIGHSMGTAVFFASVSRGYLSPDYFKSMTALAPVSALSLENVRSPLKYLAPIAKRIQTTLRLVGDRNDLMANQMLNSLWDPYRACRFAHLCDNIQFLVTGFDPARAHEEMLPIIMSHNPAGSSTQTLLHFAQGIVSGHFRSFDFGSFDNLRLYGQMTPPEYDVRKVTVPVRLVYAANDWLVGAEDVKKLSRRLPNLIESEQVDDVEFSHLDFLWSRNTNRLVYKKILNFLETREVVNPERKDVLPPMKRVPRQFNLFREIVRYLVNTNRVTSQLWSRPQK